MRALIVILLLVSAPAHAFDHWQAAGNAMIIMDWMQTKEIVRNPEFQEGNPFLGRNPSMNRVDFHFGSVLLLYNAINYAMPDGETKRTMNQAMTFIEGAVFIHNSFKGVRLKFKF